MCAVYRFTITIMEYGEIEDIKHPCCRIYHYYYIRKSERRKRETTRPLK